MMATWTGTKIQGFYEDFYNKYHIQYDGKFINSIAMGAMTKNLYFDLKLWNMYYDLDNSYSALNIAGHDGIAVDDDSVPTTIKSLEMNSYELSVYDLSVLSVNNDISWVFTQSNYPILSLTGTRGYIFAYMPEIPITETLKFETDILETYDGTEQRIANRYSADQGFNYKYYLKPGDYDTFQKIFLKNRSNIAVPIWTMMSRSSVNLPQLGDVKNILCDTMGRGYSVGDALIIWDSSSNNEVVTISALTDTDIDFNETLTGTYTLPYIAPIKRVFVQGNTETLYPKHKTGYYQFNYKNLEPKKIDSYTPAYQSGGIPIIFDCNYFGDTQQNVYLNHQELIDFNTGKVNVKQFWDEPKKTMEFRFYKNNFEDIYKLYELLNYLKGSQKIVLMPTFQGDFEIVTEYSSPATAIIVDDKGQDELFSSERRNRFVFFYNSTYYVREILNIIEGDSETLRLIFDSEFSPGTTLPVGTLGSWLVPYRLDSDTVTIKWNFYGEIFVKVKFREVNND